MRNPITSRQGFTAIELMVVLLIMTLLAAMVTPAVLTALRKSAVNEGADALREAWSIASELARQHDPGSFTGADAGKHFGVLLRQGEQGTEVTVVFDAVATAPAALVRSGSASDDAVFTRRLNASVVVSRRVAAADSLDAGTFEMVWYAQFGTGLPIAPDSLSQVVQPPVAVGVAAPTSMPGTVTLCEELLLHTLDYQQGGAGHGAQIAIYHSGISSVETL